MFITSSLLLITAPSGAACPASHMALLRSALRRTVKGYKHFAPPEQDL